MCCVSMACCSGKPSSARPPPRTRQGSSPSERRDGLARTLSARDVLRQHQLPELVADKLEEQDIRTLQTLAGLDDDVLLGELELKLGEKIKLRQAVAYARSLSRPGKNASGGDATSDDLGLLLRPGRETKVDPTKNLPFYYNHDRNIASWGRPTCEVCRLSLPPP